MVYALIFFAQLFVLFLFSRRLTKGLYKLFYRLTKSHKWAAYLYALIFAPGTLIHEASHFLMALFLLVPVGQLEIIPEIQGDKIKLGSTPIAKTDPIRRTLVGFAPFLFGVTLILVIVNFVVTSDYANNTLYILLAIYFIFEIGNTMFLSKEDLKGAWKLFLLMLFLCGFFYLIGVRFSVDSDSTFVVRLTNIFKEANLFLFVPLGLDLVAVVFLRLLGF